MGKTQHAEFGKEATASIVPVYATAGMVDKLERQTKAQKHNADKSQE